MKIGRNDPCPCGSGKKYKRCCMSDHSADTPPADPLAEVKDEINKFMEGKQFASLEDLEAQVQSFYQQRNQTPLDDFQGLSPDQMYRMLNFPFDTPQMVTFPQVLATVGFSPSHNPFQSIGRGHRPKRSEIHSQGQSSPKFLPRGSTGIMGPRKIPGQNRVWRHQHRNRFF